MKGTKLIGFTLIELLIVIVIIGILASALIPRVKGMQEKAKIRAASKQLHDFNTALMLARVTDLRTLKEITKSGCTDCPCRPESGAPEILRNLPPTHECRTKWVLSLQRITSAAGMESGDLLNMELDPRGSPYLLAENEGEYGPGDCRTNSIRSIGPDGKTGGGDDIYLEIPPVFCPKAY